MYKVLSDTKDAKRNKVQQYLIESNLNNLERGIENTSKDDINKIEEINKVADVVKIIHYFNELNQSGQGLKFLMANQMLCRLQIALAQLKSGNNSEKNKK